jgi:hypothetical protein
MPSTHAGIEKVRKFFTGVMEALPDKNAAADDILPAVCDGMQRCTQLAPKLVSSFQYLADIWPQEGLDEKTTYILVTCSIAASHFASGQVPASVPTLGAHTIDVNTQTTDETIRQLEDLLHNM